MTNITVRDSFEPKLSHQDIERAEHRLKITLPTDYKEFLLTHNGGRLEPNRFPIRSNRSDTHGILNWLFGVREHGQYSLVDEAMRFQGRVPPDLLPIGEDPGGNLICLAIAGPNRTRIYFWTHEEEVDEDETPGYDNVYFVANSFTDLLERLTEFPRSK
jgi:cell wall assembly regulator SMI1